MGLLFKLSLVAAMAAHGADLASTENCLGAGRCREMNPWLARYEQPAVFGAAKMGVAAGSGLATYEVYKRNHPKVATVLNFVVAGAYTAIAVHNARVAGQ